MTSPQVRRQRKPNYSDEMIERLTAFVRDECHGRFNWVQAQRIGLELGRPARSVLVKDKMLGLMYVARPR
jgi:hypothetical protein